MAPHRNAHTRHSSQLLTTVLVAVGLALAACAPTVSRVGHHFSEEEAQQVQTGMSQAQVAGVLGSPTTTAVIDGSQTHYYISSTTQQVAFFSPKETDRKVLAVSYDQFGAVQRIDHYGLKDGKVINFSKNETASHTRNESIIRALFRNLGTRQLYGE